VANTKTNQDLFRHLRANGLRKRTARLISEATDGRRKPSKAVHRTVNDLKKLVREAEDQISGGPAKRKLAARKAAATRKRNQQRRSAAAKRGARTRAKAR
jgi:hypothetical protein